MPVTSCFARLPIPDKTFHQHMLDCFAEAANKHDREALVDAATGRSYTFAKCAQTVKILESSLHRVGMAKGDVVLVALANSPEYLLLALAVMATGASFSPINPLANREELHSQMASAGARFVCACEQTLPTVLQACETHSIHGVIFVDPAVPIPPVQCDVPLYHIDELITADILPDLPAVEIDPREDVCLLPYSSGTTGLPKGVMLTHRAVVAMVVQLKWLDMCALVEPNRRDFAELNKTDFERVGVNMEHEYLMGHLPMFHVFGFMYPMQTLATGWCSVVMPGFRPPLFCQAIQQYRIKIVNLVPPIAQFLAKSEMCDQYDLSSMRCIISGAAPMTVETERKLQERYPRLTLIGQGYGMTETSVATHLPAFAPGYHGNGGQLVPNMTLKIEDPETGRELGEGEDGEICVKGDTLMKGYLNNPAATAAAFDSHGFLHTGDVGHYRGEYIFIVDRIKELIKVKGYQVAPAELEGLLQVHESVSDAAVVGVANERTGELPKAFVVVKPGHELSEGDVKQYIAARVSPYKRLEGGVEFVHEIPKSPSGKILRRLLRQTQPVKSKL